LLLLFSYNYFLKINLLTLQLLRSTLGGRYCYYGY